MEVHAGWLIFDWLDFGRLWETLGSGECSESVESGVSSVRKVRQGYRVVLASSEIDKVCNL